MDSLLLEKALNLLGMDKTRLIEYEDSELNTVKNIAKICVYGNYGSHETFYKRVIQEGIVYYWLHYEKANQYFDSAESYLKALDIIECYQNGDNPSCRDAEKILHRLSCYNALNQKIIESLESISNSDIEEIKGLKKEVYDKICNLDNDSNSDDES